MLHGILPTHTDLVRVAFDWLVKRRHCSVVISELVTAAGEVPDAIGWRGGLSTLVECKVSVSDFRADRNKDRHRHPMDGLGNYRYYMVPEFLESKVLDFVPDGWGLLVPRDRGIFIVRQSRGFRANGRREIDMLISLTRRLAETKIPLSGVGIKCYKHELASANPVAQVSIAP